jgi:hypothetical protein
MYFKHKHYIHGFISHLFCNKYKYVGVTNERNTPPVDRQGRLDYLPPLDQLEALQIFFK